MSESAASFSAKTACTKRHINPLLALLVLPLLLVVTTFFMRGSRYKGRTAAQWMQRMQMPAENAENDPGLVALKQLGKSAVPALRKGLKSNLATERQRAVWALSQIGTAASNAIPELIIASQDSNVVVRAGAIQALASIGVSREDLLPLMLQNLTNSDWHVSSASAQLINRIEWEQEAQGKLDYDRYQQHSSMFLKATAPAARIASLPRFVKLSARGEQVATEFEQLLNDANGWVREETVKTLRRHQLAEQRFILSTGASNFMTYYWIE